MKTVLDRETARRMAEKAVRVAKKPQVRKIHYRTYKDGVKVTEGGRELAIRLFCTECLGYGEVHPKDCESKDCPLYHFRGKSMLNGGKR